MPSTTDDPIRADVERVLHAVVGAALAVPTHVAAAVPRCVRRGVDRAAPLVEPWRVARSLFDLVATGDRGGAHRPPEPTQDAPAPAPAPAEEAVSATTTPHARDDVQLPIDDYESLAASQVVDRLPTLTPAELEILRDFESAHRGRRTVLGRIEQLLA